MKRLERLNSDNFKIIDCSLIIGGAVEPTYGRKRSTIGADCKRVTTNPNGSPGNGVKDWDKC